MFLKAYGRVERQEIAKLAPTYAKRREITRKIANFWPVALMHHDLVLVHIQHNFDQTALNYLEDVWVVRDPEEHRAFTLEFVRSMGIATPLY